MFLTRRQAQSGLLLVVIFLFLLILWWSHLHRKNVNATLQRHTSWNLTCGTIPEVAETSSKTIHSQRSLQDTVQCTDRPLLQRYERRSDVWVLYNYVPATERARCWESITYTTHADASFLDNLGPLVRRWRGPISVALYAPGDLFPASMRIVRWVRACVEPPLVERHVSFHVLFDAKDVPNPVPAPDDVAGTDLPINCSETPWMSPSAATRYRFKHSLLYPINVARNVAREGASTHFIFASDIEMYPSPGMADAFLEMVHRNPEVLGNGHRVFPIPPFEVKSEADVPDTKEQLVHMLREGSARPFHEPVCGHCHRIPDQQAWLCSPPHPSGELRVTAVARRIGVLGDWEPFYIGTHSDPLYDERLTWEGMSDKIVQGYVMCLMDYEFLVLDNAFLVHRPGFKENEMDGELAWRRWYVKKTNEMLAKQIVPEFIQVYGDRDGCHV